MRTALITTTINTPGVLALYRKLDPTVRFFIAGDEKTPIAAYDFCESIDNCVFYSPSMQRDLGYECSDLIGWNTIARRNIALLEALKWGADVIVTVDDDNAALDSYFTHFYKLWYHPPFFHGLKVSSLTHWFDPASLQFPTDGKPVVQRGFPQHSTAYGGQAYYEPVTDVRIGVAQGMILLDPDTSAIDRISRHPQVHQISELLRAGIVVDPRDTWVPLNSQNLAFIRELAPAFLMVPAFQRHDDIMAGFIAQRVMRELNLHVHFGQPLVVQQRNPHNLINDLEAEMWGMKYTERFIDVIEHAAGVRSPLQVTGMVDRLYADLWHADVVSKETRELSAAWLRDCVKVMK